MGLGIFEEFKTACVYVGIPVIVVYCKIITALIEYCFGVSRCSKLFRAYCCVKTGIFIA